MLTLPQTISLVMGACAPLGSERSFKPSARETYRDLCIACDGPKDDRRFQNDQRGLNRAPWSPLRGGRTLVHLIGHACVPTGPIVRGIDETIERQCGEKIAAQGIYRDPVRSSQAHFVKARGLRGGCLLLLAPAPWARRIWG
jgi:hypothetical protein